MVEKMNTGDHKNGIIIEIGEADFESVILKSKEANIVVFSAPWSHPCQILEAILQGIAADSTIGFNVFKIDADKNPDLSLAWEIQSVPTLLYFFEGTLRTRIVGTVSKETIVSKLQSVISGDHFLKSHF